MTAYHTIEPLIEGNVLKHEVELLIDFRQLNDGRVVYAGIELAGNFLIDFSP